MEIITPLAQPAELPKDNHPVGHGAPEAESAPEPEEFDAALSDESSDTAEAEAPAPDQIRAEYTEEFPAAESPQGDVIEEIMNRWSGVTGAFSEKKAPEQGFSRSLPIDAAIPLEQSNAVISDTDEGAAISDSKNTDGENTQPKPSLVQSIAETPVAEAEPLPNQTLQPPTDRTQSADNISDEVILPKPDKGASPTSEPNQRGLKTDDKPDAAKDAIDIPESGEAQEEGKPAHTDQRTASSKGQPATTAPVLTQDAATSQNGKAGIADLPGQPRNVVEAGTSHAANLVSETRLTVAPPPVNRQIADAIITASDKMVEVKLAPEELGRVRMVLTGQDRSPHLTIWVERPETLEQMRRNGSSLLQDLHDAGMTEATVDFRDGRHEQADADTKEAGDDGRDSWGTNTLPESQLTPRLAAASYMLSGTRGIDIRV